MAFKEKRVHHQAEGNRKLASIFNNKFAGLINKFQKQSQYTRDGNLFERGECRSGTPNTQYSSESCNNWVDEVEFCGEAPLRPGSGMDKLLSEMTDEAFEDLLDELQLPGHLREQLRAFPVAKKQAMLNSQSASRQSANGKFSPFSLVSPTSPSGAVRNPVVEPIVFVNKLRIQYNDVKIMQELRVLLKNEAVSWTSDFLRAGGLELLNTILKNVKMLPKKKINKEKLLQEILRCYKALLTHQDATRKLIRDPQPFYLMRDIIFVDKARCEIATCHLIIDIFHVLSTTRSFDLNGYDLLFQLLLDRIEDTNTEEERDKFSRKECPFLASTSGNFPPVYARRFRSWMRELESFVDKNIEPITFLARALRYDFKSIARPAPPPMPAKRKSIRVHSRRSPQRRKPSRAGRSAVGIGSGRVAHEDAMLMVDVGVVEYLLSHLQLIKFILHSPPASIWHQQGLDNMALQKELLASGLDRVVKKLLACPHPKLLSTYLPHLQSLFPQKPPLTLSSPTPSEPHSRRTANRRCDATSSSCSSTTSSVSTPPSSIKNGTWICHENTWSGDLGRGYIGSKEKTEQQHEDDKPCVDSEQCNMNVWDEVRRRILEGRMEGRVLPWETTQNDEEDEDWVDEEGEMTGSVIVRNI
ncbi:uncharacterized protein VTP21DRAFT_1754 [Calcarisporiella thermophila]|uniref:uncharacterized protein n=1 Tax=Calcarisporiella thermophila TaxID=911321 RepID=UPI003743BC17